MHKGDAWKRKINGVGGPELGEVGIAEVAGQSQRGLAVVLEASAVELVGIVERSVVGLPVADEGEVQAGGAALLEHGHVRVDGHVLVDFIAEGRTVGMGRAGESGDEGAVCGARFEHLGDAGVAAGLEIERDADVAGPGMLGQEGGSAEQAVLLAVGEEKDDIVAQRRAGPQSAQGFE